MAIQPILNETLDISNAVKFNIVRRAEYCDLETTKYDLTHIHSCYEIYVNIEGDISFFHDQNIYDISSRDVVFSKPGETHYCIYHSSCLHDHFCLWFDDRGGSVTEYINRIKIPPAIRLSDEGKKQLMTLLSQLSDSDTDPLYKLAKLIDLLTLFGDGKPLSNGSTKERPQKITDILAYIDSHYKEIRTSTELADAFFISQSTLNRLFRKYVGLTVFQIIDARRLSHAENLLRNGSSVMDACFQSGFTDCSKFIILFKKTFGVTPLRYKQALFKS